MDSAQFVPAPQSAPIETRNASSLPPAAPVKQIAIALPSVASLRSAAAAAKAPATIVKAPVTTAAAAKALAAIAKAPAATAKAPAATTKAPAVTIEDAHLGGDHCAQIATPSIRQFLTEDDLTQLDFDDSRLFLGDKARQIPFFDRPDRERSPLHWGQMKLFLCELWFLLSCLQEFPADALTTPRLNIVYAGAAPGNHIAYLASLFPSCHFVLYDPAPYCAAISSGKLANVEAHTEYFTEATTVTIAKRFGGGAPFVFISDIRTGKEESYVQEDMERQRKWIEDMRPARSMVKFRLPWGAGKTPYLAGRVMLGTFHPLTSTESRLIVDRELTTREYDNQEYERQCAYHNSIGRVRAYHHEVVADGLDHCHDCAALVYLAGEYLRHQRGQKATAEEIGLFIDATCAAFETGRTLATEYTRSSNRAAKQFPTRDHTGDVLTISGARKPPPVASRRGRAPAKK